MNTAAPFRFSFPSLGSGIRRCFGSRIYGALSCGWMVARMIWRTVIDSGYARSAYHQLAMDKHGDPLPWYTYSAIAYFERLNWLGMRICEFGGGQSTRWWLARAAAVTVIETDAAWCARIRAASYPPATVIHASTLLATIAAIPEADVYVIDTMPALRHGIAEALVPRLMAKGGIVILDNAESSPDIENMLNAVTDRWASFDGIAVGAAPDRTTIWWIGKPTKGTP